MEFIKKLIQKVTRKRSRSKKKTSSLLNKFDGVRSILRQILLVAIVIGVVFILPIIISINVYHLSKVELKSLSDSGSSIEWEGDSRISILFVGVDKQDNGYDFIDFLSIVEIDPIINELKIFNINPLFAVNYITNDDFTVLKNILAVNNSESGESIEKELLNGVQGLTALKIDSYVLVSSDGFNSIFGELGTMKIESPSMLTDDDLPSSFSISKGENRIDSKDFINFVSADQNGQDDKMERQLFAFESILREFKILNFLIHFDQNIQKVESNLITNLDIKSLMRIAYMVRFSNDIEFKVGYTRSHPGYILNTGIGRIWRPVYEDIDQDIRKIFTINNVKLEQPRVDVLNSTDRAGFARIRARWLENRGIRVVKTDNFSDKIEQNRLYVEDVEKYAGTIREIKETLYSDIEIIPKAYPGRSVGELVLILGSNEVMFE